MIIKRPNEFGKLMPIELEDFERANNVRLPQDYRDFLLQNNGGIPIPNRNPSPDTIVSYIFGMHNGEYYASLYKRIDVFSKRLPLATFPIASDPFGNLFLMSLHFEGFGNIYFWDHEGEPKIQDGHFIDNCYFVANSFSEFLTGLK